MKYVKLTLDNSSLKNKWLKKLFDEQSKRLQAYAERELTLMAESHEFQNQTYNLQDSLVYILFYNGKIYSSGMYGEKRASEMSKLHAWGRKDRQVDVDGRALAEAFVNSYTPTIKKGWEVVWAATAPYGAYLEKGSTPHSLVFRVISQRYDHIKQELEPRCTVTIEINPPTY